MFVMFLLVWKVPRTDILFPRQFNAAAVQNPILFPKAWVQPPSGAVSASDLKSRA